MKTDSEIYSIMTVTHCVSPRVMLESLGHECGLWSGDYEDLMCTVFTAVVPSDGELMVSLESLESMMGCDYYEGFKSCARVIDSINLK